MKKVAVIGAGSWGTALAHHLRSSGWAVNLWGRDLAVLESIKLNNSNPRYLNGAALASGILPSDSLTDVIADARLIVVAVPSTAVREVAENVAKVVSPNSLVVSGVKGLEPVTHLTVTQILAEEWGAPERIGVLGGPSFALEVAKGLPTALTVAAHSHEVASEMREFFHFNNVRVYTSTDIIGVEIAGALKNVIALAVGLVDGSEMGQNARAALITRGLMEIQEIATAMGGDPRTIFGLSGLGDLLLTAVGDLSRNRQVGLRLARGEKLEAIVVNLGQVAEGVRTTSLVIDLAQARGLKVPIIEQVQAVVSGQKTVKDAIKTLFSRDPIAEFRS